MKALNQKSVDWPFQIDRRQFEALSPNQKIEIEGVIRYRIEVFEAISRLNQQTHVEARPNLRLVPVCLRNSERA